MTNLIKSLGEIKMYSKSRSNRIIKSAKTTIFSLCLFLLIPLSACKDQLKGKLDVTTYETPSGYTAEKSTPLSRSFIKKNGDKFSVITIYASTDSFGDPNTDFSQRWQQLSGEKTLPKIEQTSVKNVKIASGTGAVNFQGVNAVAALTTLTVNDRLITVSCIFTDEQAKKDYQAFIDGLDLDDNFVNQKTTNVAKKTSTSSNNQTVATATSVGLQKLFGRWTEYSYGGSFYAGGRTETPALSYTLNSDGTFGESKGAEIGNRFSKSGRYQASENILKLIYKDGSVQQYSYKYRANTGKYTWDYLIMTKQGSNQEDYFVGREGK
jgi:hypothetical protein